MVHVLHTVTDLVSIEEHAIATMEAHDIDILIRTTTSEIIDAEVVESILSSPPFIKIDSLFNTRDISDGTNAALRRGYVFRSGSLEKITEDGKGATYTLCNAVDKPLLDYLVCVSCHDRVV